MTYIDTVTVGNILRTLLHGEPPPNLATAKEIVDESLSIAMHAMRVGMHTTLGSSPGNLVFNRDMFLNIPLIADWHAITQKREHLINKNLIRENQKRRRYDYLRTSDTYKWHSNYRVETRSFRETKTYEDKCRIKNEC